MSLARRYDIDTRLNGSSVHIYPNDTRGRVAGVEIDIMADGVARCPLPDGKIYHFNIIYNHARCPLSVTPDTQLSRAFTEQVVATLQSLGYVNSYYQDRDCPPGKTLFTELVRVVDGSQYTLVVLTPGFVHDCWSRYICMTSFKKLLDVGHRHHFIPISVGLNDDSLPAEVNAENVLFFDEDWAVDKVAWKRLSVVIVEDIPVSVVNRDDSLKQDLEIEESKAPEDSHADGFDGEDIVDHQAEPDSVVKPSLISTSETSGASTVTSSPDFDETDDASIVNVKDKEIWSPPQNGHPVIEEGATVHIPSPEAGSSNPTEIGIERQMDLGNIPVVAHIYEDMSAYIDKAGKGLDQTLQCNTQTKEQAARNQTDARTSGGSASSREQQSGGLPDIPKDIGLIGDRVSATNTFSETSIKHKTDHEEIEVSVVNRLEGTGMQSYRQELYRDQTRRQSVHVTNIKAHSPAADSLHTTRRKSSGDAMQPRYRPKKHKVSHAGQMSHTEHDEHTSHSSVSSVGSLEAVDSAHVTVHASSSEAMTGIKHPQAGVVGERGARHEQIHNSHVTTTAANHYYSVVSGPILKPPSLDLEKKQDDDDDDDSRSSMNRVETSSRSPMKSRGTQKDKAHIARREKHDREFLMAKQTLTDTILLTNTNMNTNTNTRSFVDRDTNQMQLESNVADNENRQSPPVSEKQTNPSVSEEQTDPSVSEEQTDPSTHQESSPTISPDECTAPDCEGNDASTILVKSTVDVSSVQSSSVYKSENQSDCVKEDMETVVSQSDCVKEDMEMVVSQSDCVKEDMETMVSQSDCVKEDMETVVSQSDCVKEDMETAVSQVLQVDQEQSSEELSTTSETAKRQEITTSITDDSPDQRPSLASRLLPLCKVIIHILSRAEQPFYV